MDQRTDEWFQARLGCVTASRIADVIARTKTGWGATRANYMAQLISERLTGVRIEGFTNEAMRWGTDTEPEARIAYEFYQDATVVETGFVMHPSIADSGASPDGLVGDDGLVEIKCPNTATHIDTLLGQPVADKYVVQALWQMACTGRRWVDFVSFDPRMPESMRLFVKRIERDDQRIAELEAMVVEFLKEVREKEEALRQKYGAEVSDEMPEAARLVMAG